MELLRGPKPLTEVERVFAAEKARLICLENAVCREMNPDLLKYASGYGCSRFTRPVDHEPTPRKRILAPQTAL